MTRFGLLGYGKFAREIAAPAITESGHALTYIGSNRQAHPTDYVGPVTADYDQVIASDQIDAVYVVLPNHRHLEYTTKALTQGVPVLCEKPLGLTAQEVHVIQDCARTHHTYVQEAFMVAHHPQWHWMREQLTGAPQIHLAAAFQYYNPDSQNIRNRADTGGGARLDIGCYGLWAAHWLGARSIKRVEGFQTREAGVDLETVGRLVFHEGITLQLDVSMRRARFQQAIIQTPDQCWMMPRPFNPPEDAIVWTMDPQGIASEHRFRANQYHLMLDAFSTAVTAGTEADLSTSLRIASWSDTIRDEFIIRSS